MSASAVLAATAGSTQADLTWVEAVILGIVQGLTEFLPISSSAHVLIVSELLGYSDPGAAFTAVTQIGTESAVLIYFRRDIWRIASAWVRALWTPELRGTPDVRMGWLVIIGTLPISILGLVLSHQIETVARSLVLVGCTLIIGGLVLGFADATARNEKPLEDLSWRDGIIYGFAQALALVPGVSRSGATISAGLFMGYTREAATRFAFLLAIPAVLASGFYEATKIGDDSSPQWMPTLLATVIAFVIGYAVIAWLLKFVSTHSYRGFVIYRLVVGAAVLVLVGVGVL